MKKVTARKLFHDKRVRVHWDNELEKWYFAIIDIISILTKSESPRKFWNDLKSKLKTEGSELSDKIGQLKMEAPYGKMRLAGVSEENLEKTTGRKVVLLLNVKKISKNTLEYVEKK